MDCIVRGIRPVYRRDRAEARLVALLVHESATSGVAWPCDQRAWLITQGLRVTKSNLAVRLITAGVAVPLLLLLMFRGPVWGWHILVLLATAIAAQELFGMTHPGDLVSQGIGVLLCLLASLGIYFGVHQIELLISTALLVPIVGVLVPLWRLGDLGSAAFRVMANVAGPFYLGGLLATIALLRRDIPLGGQYVLFTLMIAWLGDTGGYFFGRFLGKRKLYEKISPKKTRAGFVGALVGAALAAIIARSTYLPTIPLLHAVLLALFAGALGQFGDLVESLIKRSTGIKDSGWIVPGHGGLLDRIDAVLVVSPLVYLYAVWQGVAAIG